MKNSLFVFVWLLFTPPLLRADAPTYGLVHVDASTDIHEGASLKSKVAGPAEPGDEFVLRGDKLYNGFYKIEYSGHVCFIQGSKVSKAEAAKNDDVEEKPKVKDKVQENDEKIVDKKDEGAKDDKEKAKEHDEGEVKKDDADKKDHESGDDHDEKEHVAPSAVATAEKKAPKEEKEDKNEEERPRSTPTALATKAPTKQPTAESSEEEATAVPTRQAVREATPLPREEPTSVPTENPRLVPTEKARPQHEEERPQPTARPTSVPTPYPTAIPARVYETPVPTPQQLRTLRTRGRVLATPVPTQVYYQRRYQQRDERRSRGRQEAPLTVSSYGSSGIRTTGSSRHPGDAIGGGFYFPMGLGKPYDVKPAFKPLATDLDSRNIGSSGFIGIGGEVRLVRWLRLFSDWTYSIHDTLAANSGTAATAVGVPAVSSVISGTDIHYFMADNCLRLGVKASLPLGWVEPWIGGGAGLYIWNAGYKDSANTVDYGQDHGAAFGLSGMLGLDFNIDLGGMVIVITPYGELGSPVVNPTVTDIAGTGSEWTDEQGTAVVVPRRLGIQFGLSF